MATRALLLTDIVDSTKLTEQLGDARAAALWTAHDRLARDLLAVHRGREIDRADGFLLLFDAAAEAAAFAEAYHAALVPLGIEARVGLHVAPVSLRENPAADVARGAKPIEVEGLAKSVVARVMSVANGGQTLATPEAIAALGVARLTPEPDGRVRADGLVAVSHGHWQLKGVLDPVELFEVGVRGAATFAPPPDASKAWRVRWDHDVWVPVREVKHRLPAERDTFVGRREDLKELAARIDDGARLVSLLGVGGTGKTRLALHYGWTWLGAWPGGVWFCDLSEARSVDGIAYAVAAALDVQLGKDDPVVHLGQAIAGRGRCLVILDNFEQIARHASETAGAWLDKAPQATFLVTTREILGLPGEQALALAPLVPPDAEALFDARARSAHRDYTPDPAAVLPLVTLLDGLPLAIELAAARVRLMPPHKLLQRIGERFKLLTSTGGRRDRQATLRATLDWSWELLPVDEQRALAQLAVFEGGFTLDAVEAVLSLAEQWPPDAVQGLVDKSLVRRRSDARFDQLVSVHAYAAEKLDASGERSAVEVRHGRSFATFGTDEALDGLHAHGGVTRLRALAADVDNLVVASRRAALLGDGPTATATALAAWAVLDLRGPLTAALALLVAARDMPGQEPGALAAVDIACGRASRALGRLDEAHRFYERALDLARSSGDRRREGQALYGIGSVHSRNARLPDAIRNYGEALALAREVGDLPLEGLALNGVGSMHRETGELDIARADIDAAIAVTRRAGDRQTEAMALSNLGDLDMLQGRMDKARGQLEAALQAARDIGNRQIEGLALGNRGEVERLAGNSEEAHTLLEQALAIHQDHGLTFAQPYWLNGLALLTAETQPDESLARAHASVSVAAPYPIVLADALAVLARVHLARRETAAARTAIDRARQLGCEGLVSATIAATQALVAVAEGNRDLAAASLAEATANPTTGPPGTELAQLVQRARDAIVSATRT